MVIYDIMPKVNICNHSETTPKDHLIILCEFLTGNKAHATSSSIRARVNCSTVQVNFSQASIKLHLSCTLHSYSHIPKSNIKVVGHPFTHTTQ